MLYTNKDQYLYNKKTEGIVVCIFLLYEILKRLKPTATKLLIWIYLHYKIAVSNKKNYNERVSNTCILNISGFYFWSCLISSNWSTNKNFVGLGFLYKFVDISMIWFILDKNSSYSKKKNRNIIEKIRPAKLTKLRLFLHFCNHFFLVILLIISNIL